MTQTNNIDSCGTSSTGANPARANEEQLFVSIYTELARPFYEIVLLKTRNKQMAEDILHDVFTRLWLQRNKLKEIKDIKSYLAVLVYNQFIDVTRKKKNDKVAVRGYNLCKDPVWDLNEDIGQKENQRLLQLAIQALSPQRKKVFVLGWLEGWNRKQIATQLNISENTAKNVMQEARREIRKYMTQVEPGREQKILLKKLRNARAEEKELKVA